MIDEAALGRAIKRARPETEPIGLGVRLLVIVLAIGLGIIWIVFFANAEDDLKRDSFKTPDPANDPAG